LVWGPRGFCFAPVIVPIPLHTVQDSVTTLATAAPTEVSCVRSSEPGFECMITINADAQVTWTGCFWKRALEFSAPCRKLWPVRRRHCAPSSWTPFRASLDAHARVCSFILRRAQTK
jgi:hypothetical protein